MKLYFAAFSTAPSIFKDINHKELLESYLYFRKKGIPEYMFKHGLQESELFLDSGAYSAATRGEVINLDEYIQFIKDNKQYISVYANLDVIGDWQKTKANQEYMESRGLMPLATFHFGSPLSELEEMCLRYDYIALGGLVPFAKQRKRLEKWLDTCFAIILKNNKKRKTLLKVHGFGVNAYWAWIRYPFYSVDATSWQASGRFAEEYVFKNGKPVRESSLLTAYKVNSKTYQDRFRTSIDVLVKSRDFVTRLWDNRGYKYE